MAEEPKNPEQLKAEADKAKADADAKAKADADAKAKADADAKAATESGKCAYWVEDQKDGSIRINPWKNGRAPTTEELAFLRRIDRTDKKISSLVKNKEAKADYEDGINSAARMAFQCPPDLLSGNLAMDGIEEKFLTTEGPRLRRRFLVGTIGLGAMVAGIALIVAILIALLASLPSIPFPWADVRHIIYVADWIAVGIGVGMIFFAFVNSLNITYDNIGRFDPSGLDPWLRLSLSIVVAIILCAFLKTRVIEITIVSLALNDFDKDTLNAAIICFFIGIFVAATDGVAIRLISTTFSSTTAKTSGK